MNLKVGDVFKIDYDFGTGTGIQTIYYYLSEIRFETDALTQTVYDCLTLTNELNNKGENFAIFDSEFYNTAIQGIEVLYNYKPMSPEEDFSNRYPELVI